MATVPNSSASEGARDRAAPPLRRKLLVQRGGHDAAPRVVLHLPDLEALAAVAIGPPTPAGSRRRVDAAHAAVPAAHHDEAPTGPSVVGQAAQALSRFLKEPYEAGGPRSAGTGATLVHLAAILQRPKVMAAGVTALGLQLAAVLALFLGETKQPETNTTAADDTAPPAVSWPISTPGREIGGREIGGREIAGPIQTPLSSPPGLLNSPGIMPTPFGDTHRGPLPGTAAGPTLVVQPNMPAPQSLPTLDPRDLPPWGGNSLTPSLGPQLAGPDAAAPSQLKANGAPTPAPPRGTTLETLPLPSLTAPALGNANVAAPSASESVLPLPTLPSLGSSKPTSALPVSNGGGAGRPKARLQGTIQKVSPAGNN
jgi:hypothetical protein